MRNLVLILICLTVLAGCGMQRESMPQETPAIDIMPVTTASQSPAELSISSDNNAYADPNRDLAYQVEMKIKTEQPDSVHRSLTHLAKTFDGYIISASLNKTIFKIKADYLNEAIDSVGQLGEIDKKEITGIDITDRYVDYNKRLKNALAIRENYLNLLKKNNSNSESIRLQKELEAVNAKIELLEGKIFKLENMVYFAEFTVSTKGEVKPGLIGGLFAGLYNGVKWLIVR